MEIHASDLGGANESGGILKEHLSGSSHRYRTGSLVTGGLMKGEEIRILNDCCPQAESWRGLTQGCVEDMTTQAQGPLLVKAVSFFFLFNFYIVATLWNRGVAVRCRTGTHCFPQTRLAEERLSVLFIGILAAIHGFCNVSVGGQPQGDGVWSIVGCRASFCSTPKRLS